MPIPESKKEKLTSNIKGILTPIQLKQADSLLCICTLRSDFEGGRKVVLQPAKRWVYIISPHFSLGLQTEKNLSLQNHFSTILKITSKCAD